MEVLLYAVVAVVGLWVLWKALGLLLDLATAPGRRRVRESVTGVAVQRAVAATGKFDGGHESKRRAREAVIRLASDGPYSLRLPVGVTIEDLADAFAEGHGASGQPILLEAAYLVVGAHRTSFPSDPSWSSPEERKHEQSQAFFLTSLFPDWVKSRQVGGPGAMREQTLRLAMVVDILLEKCVQDGLLADGD